MRTDCIHCNLPFRRVELYDPIDAVHGDVYSDAGERETQLSGYCEYCFDNMFADECDDDLLDEDEGLMH